MIQVAATKNEEMSQIDSLNDEISALKKKLAEAATGGGSASGLSTEAQLKLKNEYEKQISEINGKNCASLSLLSSSSFFSSSLY